jgi:curved DNA-binding protein CbpA
MAEIKIKIQCKKEICWNCRMMEVVRGSKYNFCLAFGKMLRCVTRNDTKRLPECLAAEGEIARLEETEKEDKQWNDANCNECPISAFEACDEICRSKKTLIEKIAELTKEDGGRNDIHL